MTKFDPTKPTQTKNNESPWMKGDKSEKEKTQAEIIKLRQDCDLILNIVSNSDRSAETAYNATVFLIAIIAAVNGSSIDQVLPEIRRGAKLVFDNFRLDEENN